MCWLRDAAIEVGTATASEVPAATCIPSAAGTPSTGNMCSKSGIRNSPPPMPNNPEAYPDTNPTAISNKASTYTRFSCATSR